MLVSNANGELYRIEPGATVPSHSHFGDELTLVVQGGFSDEVGSYGPGDICLKTPSDTHAPVGDDDGTSLSDFLADENALNPEDVAGRQSLRAVTRDMLESLTERADEAELAALQAEFA